MTKEIKSLVRELTLPYLTEKCSWDAQSRTHSQDDEGEFPAFGETDDEGCDEAAETLNQHPHLVTNALLDFVDVTANENRTTEFTNNHQSNVTFPLHRPLHCLYGMGMKLCVWFLCYPLCEARVELSRLVDIEPADVLLHDSVEKQLADELHLPSGRQRPEGHLQVGGNQHDGSQDGVVDGKAGRADTQSLT